MASNHAVKNAFAIQTKPVRPTLSMSPKHATAYSTIVHAIDASNPIKNNFLRLLLLFLPFW